MRKLQDVGFASVGFEVLVGLMMIFVHPAQCEEWVVSLKKWECMWLGHVVQTPQEHN